MTDVSVVAELPRDRRVRRLRRAADLERHPQSAHLGARAVAGVTGETEEQVPEVPRRALAVREKREQVKLPVVPARDALLRVERVSRDLDDNRQYTGKPIVVRPRGLAKSQKTGATTVCVESSLRPT